jgi:hypothetical protein
MDDDYAKPEGPVEADLRVEKLEFTTELLQDGLKLWDLPLHNFKSEFADVMDGIFALPWDAWTPTVAVSEIFLSTDPAPGLRPPETVWARVSIFGFGWEPGVAVAVKWNNAFGFPDNGAGANSILLPSPTPDAHGRFAFQVLHKAVRRPAKDWLWGDNLQLVLDAQQRIGVTASRRESYQRGIPGHVLWQWIP